MDSKNIKISNTTTDSITLSADTIINPMTWTTVTGTAIPEYVTTTTIPTPTITYEKLAPVKDIVKKEEKLDPRIVKINKEINELKKKTVFSYIKEYVPEKVYGFKFKITDKEYKTICADEDTFSLPFAFALAYAKWDAGDILTIQGLIQRANDYFDFKRQTKEIKNGIKLFYKLQEKEVLEEQIKAEKKYRHDKLVQKKIEKRKHKEDEQIKIIKTAIKASKYEL